MTERRVEDESEKFCEHYYNPGGHIRSYKKGRIKVD